MITNSDAQQEAHVKLRHLVVCISLLALAVTADAKDKNPFLQNLPFESGKIQYAISGMEEGTEILYVRGYGEQTATYRQTITSMMGMKVENKTLEITDPEWVYSYDLNEESGVKSVNPIRLMVEEYEKLSGAEQNTVQQNSERFGMSVVNGLGGSVEQFAARILGYDCDKSSAMGVTVYSIRGSSLPLKTESDLMGMKMDMVATSLDKGRVDGKYFKHPAGIEAIYDKESEMMARHMAQQTIAWLKDPYGSSSPQMRMMQSGPTQHAGGRMHHVAEDEQPSMDEAMKLLKGMFGDQPQPE